MAEHDPTASGPAAGGGWPPGAGPAGFGGDFHLAGAGSGAGPAAAAGPLRDAASAVAAGARSLTSADPGARAFGSDGPGRLGELGRELHRTGVAALDARLREAVALSDRLLAVADGVAKAAARYAQADQAAVDRLTGRRVRPDGGVPGE